MKIAIMKASVSMLSIADIAYMKNCVRLVIRLWRIKIIHVGEN